jgi:4-amino-4-deoxy-L-arabinose transferase-like glycosyltransferase
LPFFLAGVYQLFGVHFLAVKLIFILLAAVSALLVYLIGKELVNPKLGVIAAMLFAVEPSLCGITAFIYTEPLNIPLLLAAVYFLIRGVNTKRKREYFFSGIFWGLTTLCKGTTLFFPFFLVAGMMLFRKFRRGWKRLFLFLFVFVLTLVPWTVRNYKTFHVFLPIATGSGESLWTGNYFPFDGEFRYGETQKKASEITQGLSWVERDRKLGEEAKKMIRANPTKFIKLSIKKLYRFWIKVYEAVPSGRRRSGDQIIFIGLSLTHLSLLLLAGVGLFRFPEKRYAYKIILVLLLYYTFVHAATFAVPRYRIPVMPLLFPLAAFTLQQAFDFLGQKNKIFKKD